MIFMKMIWFGKIKIKILLQQNFFFWKYKFYKDVFKEYGFYTWSEIFEMWAIFKKKNNFKFFFILNYLSAIYMSFNSMCF